MVTSSTAGLVLSAKAGDVHVTVLPELQLPINVTKAAKINHLERCLQKKF
jgi:hypothetical protein